MRSSDRSPRSKPRLQLRGLDDLKARAQALNAASAKIHSTVPLRDSSAADHHAWHEATVEFRAALEQMYPESFWRDTRALAAGDTHAVEPALAFLEADPWCFRSGYVKAELMRYLSRVALTVPQQKRSQQILLHLVDVGDRREFSYACRLARANSSDPLRGELKQRLDSPDRGVRRRALQMIVSLAEPVLDAGELQAARALLTEEGLAQLAALNRDAGLGFDEPGEWNKHRHDWVRRVAPALGMDHHSFADPDAKTGPDAELSDATRPAARE